ncbi:MAG TPA: PAS domain S-box protein [Candidatus Acidoferrum sp.]|nr:PAS domain S-box protein [Candidatus Acidoferrum sp.]
MPRKLLIAASGLVSLHVAVILWIGPSANGSLLSNGIEVAISALAAAFCFGAARRGGGLSRPFWRLTGYGLAMWGVANVGWMYYEVALGTEPPAGSAVRFLFAVHAIFFAMALFLDGEKDASRLDLESILDFAQLAIVFSLVYLGFYYLPSLHADAHTAMVRQSRVEIGEDSALLALAGIQYLRSQAKHLRSLYGGLAIFLALYTTGAAISDYQALTKELPAGTWWDFCWTTPLLYAIFWAAKWHPAPDSMGDFAPPRRTIGATLITNTTFALAPLLVLLETAQLGSGWRYFSSAMLGISILCFAARLALSESLEARSAESARQHALALDSAMDGMAIIDKSGHYAYVNSAYARMMGYENLQFLLGKPWRELANERDVETMQMEIRRSLAERGKWFGALTLHHPSGAGLPVEMAVTALPGGGVVCVSRDIADRRKAELARIEPEFKYQTFVEQVAAISYIAEIGVTGQWLYVSPQVEKILGYTPDEWLANSREWIRFVAAEDRGIVEAAEAASERGEPFQAEYRLIRKDGKTVWVSDTAVVVHGSDLHPVMEGIIVDITDRKQLEMQLQRSQRMEAVGRLAGGIAHDFNNLLTIIKGYTELALKRAGISEALAGDIQQIDGAADRASTLVRQLLAFGRKQVLQPKAIDLNGVVLGLHKLLLRLMGEDIEMVLDCAKKVATVKADPGQVEQVIMNLVVNARDAMPNGGRLTIETANVDLDSDYALDHATVKPGRYVMLAVSDTGTGMDAETQTHIFEPFYTTKASGRGTGLGLSTVYGIVKQSGGYIWVYSELGRGSTFKVYLPIAEDPAEANAPPEKKGSARRGSETILLVEDEGAVRELAEALLNADGYTVLAAQDPIHAEQLCAASDGRVQLLLTDVVMPGMSGRELARRIQARAPQVRVLYMSGYTDNVIARDGMLEPGIAFLQKPFTPAMLKQKIRDVLDAPQPTRSA